MAAKRPLFRVCQQTISGACTQLMEVHILNFFLYANPATQTQSFEVRTADLPMRAEAERHAFHFQFEHRMYQTDFTTDCGTRFINHKVEN